MNCWLCSETEINSPAVHHASVCSAHTSIISGDCLSDGSVYASTSCSPRPEVSGDLKIHEHKRRRSLEDTVAQTATRRQSRTVPEDTVSKPDGPWGHGVKAGRSLRSVCALVCRRDGKTCKALFGRGKAHMWNTIQLVSLELVSSNDEMGIHVHSVQRGFNGTDHLQSHVQFE